MAEGEAVPVSQTSSAEEDHLEHSTVDGRSPIKLSIDEIAVDYVYVNADVLFLLNLHITFATVCQLDHRLDVDLTL